MVEQPGNDRAKPEPEHTRKGKTDINLLTIQRIKKIIDFLLETRFLCCGTPKILNDKLITLTYLHRNKINWSPNPKKLILTLTDLLSMSIYKINHKEIGILYIEITGFNG